MQVSVFYPHHLLGDNLVFTIAEGLRYRCSFSSEMPDLYSPYTVLRFLCIISRDIWCLLPPLSRVARFLSLTYILFIFHLCVPKYRFFPYAVVLQMSLHPESTCQSQNPSLLLFTTSYNQEYFSISGQPVQLMKRGQLMFTCSSSLCSLIFHH